MGNRLILALLFIVICCVPKQIFAEDRAKTTRRMTDEQLRQEVKEGGRERKEALREMTQPSKDLDKASGELSRAKRGEYTVKDIYKGVINDPQSLGDNERRIEKAQEKRDAAYKEWDQGRDKFDDAVYKKGSAKIELDRREKARKNNR